MARRKRIDIFFILYLTAIIGFVVVSKERDRSDERMQQLNAHIIRTFLPPLPLMVERDTVRWYVDADSSGILRGDLPLFTDKVYARDIGSRDEVSVRLHSVVYRDLLTARDIVTIGERTAVGSIRDRVVYFPVSARFPRTGTYEVNLTATARRVHETAPGRFRYRGIRFDTTLVPREMIAELEQGAARLTVQVIDTSVERPKTLETLHMRAERDRIASAVGFEEVNTIETNLSWSDPTLEIIRGSGRLERVSRDQRSSVYRWTSTVTALPDTVVIEARLDRDAGGKDISRVRFPVSGVQPFLRTPLVPALYAGEGLDLDIAVNGLEEEPRYSWTLFEGSANGDRIEKNRGRGVRVQYRIPNSFGGKQLIIEARYDGRPYRWLSQRSNAEGSSRFILPVMNPPTQIGLELPPQASVMETFRFTASRYTDPRFRGEQPIERLTDVRVELFDEENNLINTDVSMIRKGVFTFIIQDKQFIRPAGERVIVVVHAGEATVQSTMWLRR
ncbi:MAG: hypothetical protein JXA28_04450 [Bacteroidetes bacterium]|nr:hypothetical protein [Bacteroidota bacterium]